tara:strand:- start:508 stop:867 length:360 start_codon:yes stop_codon:yes gene_type:complete
MALQTPISSNEGDEESYSFSLRMHKDDWDNLKSAVTQSVIQPLRAHVIDLTTAPVLDFLLTPDTASAQHLTSSNESFAGGISTDIESGAQRWRCPSLRSEQPKDSRKVACKLKFRVRFL